jgi:SAM-dependent methyltransferase
MKSYTSQQTGMATLFAEAKNLYRSHSANVPERVQGQLREVQKFAHELESRWSLPVRNLDVLEIGPGPFLAQMTYFALNNRVTGIDLDVIAPGWNPSDYIKMMKCNGARRTIKTVGRKLLGIDRGYRTELKKQLSLSRLPDMKVLQMDVCKMRFPEDSFDLVYSRSVLHHVPQPGDAIREIRRVVKPGGIAYIGVHLYTSANGSLDLRIYTGMPDDFRYWPHLRPQLSQFLKPHAYVNKLRIKQWRELFEQNMPGSALMLDRSEHPELEEQARALQAKGELLDYTLEELLTHGFAAIWRKTAAA